MAIYAVSKTNEDWEGTERFNYKTKAEDRVRAIAATGEFVRLVRWANHQAKELDRANAPQLSDDRQPPGAK